MPAQTPERSSFVMEDSELLGTSSKSVQEQVLSGQVLLMDYRPNSAFCRSHIEGAVNICLPGILLRRLKKGKNLSLKCLIQGDEGNKDLFMKMASKVPLILYDENSSNINANSDTPFVLLLRRLKEVGYRVTYLRGGFSEFYRLFPHLCQTTEDSDSDECSLTDLGFDRLKIETTGLVEAETPLDNRYPAQILPYLYLGTKQDCENFELLSKLRIRYVLNVTPNIPNCFEDNGIKYMQIPIMDHWSQNLAAFFPKAIEFIDEARRAKSGILVHCLAGVSRSVTVTVAYLMQKLCLSLNDAYDFVKKRKSNISPNFNFMGQLKEFEQKLTTSPCRTGSCRCAVDGCHCLSPDPTSWMSTSSSASSSTSSTSSLSSELTTPASSVSTSTCSADSRRGEFDFHLDT
ncbi:dual specificity protein phosphatase 6-like [Lytechinus variegatus]|uniref:dual specificity protein phosphatase 6-like n=1 Tax=Lytechinus variegatus TaxID=7654 RepID=UPI001BB19175|nr:dual specificity protein phosphatase 6-like [Lytechinus variegatus]